VADVRSPRCSEKHVRMPEMASVHDVRRPKRVSVAAPSAYGQSDLNCLLKFAGAQWYTKC
jgi:hypothetical protein